MRIDSYTELETEVLVVGGGGAALRAAIAANQAGADVLLITKGARAKSGATYYSVAETAGFSVPTGHYDPTDSPQVFYEDIMAAAAGTAVPALVETLSEEAGGEKEFLESAGLQFARDDSGAYICNFGCFSSKRRNLTILQHLKPVLQVLEKLFAGQGIRCMEGACVTGLIVHEGECGGAFALDRNDRAYLIRAKSVILATGGAGALFRRNMYPPDITGDGYAAARRAGAVLANMEFVQSGVALAWPKINLFRLHFWEALPRLTNEKGERFLSKYIDPAANCSRDEVVFEKRRHFPFSARDISRYVEIGIQREIREGCPNARGNVYVDFGDVDFHKLFENPRSRLKQVWPIAYRQYRELGLRLCSDRLEIACFAHAMNGGVLTDCNGESSVRGLYAVGEVATGMHGADRLGGNMSVTCQVFGRRAGTAAARRAAGIGTYVPAERSRGENRDFLAQIPPCGGAALKRLHARIQQSADDNLLVLRCESGIKAFLRLLDDTESELLHKMQSAGDIAPGYRAVELRDLIETGRMIARSALQRRESRGSHYRSDYPAADPSFSRMIILS